MLKTIFSTDKEITVGESKVTIKQITLGDIPLITEIVGSVLDEKDIKAAIFKLLKEKFDDACTLITMLSSITEGEVKKLNLAAAATIISAILQENVTFLDQTLAPEIQKIKTLAAGLNKSKS